MSSNGVKNISEPPVVAPKSKKSKKKHKKNAKSTSEANANGTVTKEDHEDEESDAEAVQSEQKDNDSSASRQESLVMSATAESVKLAHNDAEDSNTARRLENAARERDELRAEVTELRKSLEGIRQRHDEDMSNLKSELEESQSSKEKAESQYQTLMGRVATIRKQLGDRMKTDAHELAQARKELEEMEQHNQTVKEENEALERQLSDVKRQSSQQADEISQLRGRTNTSQQNWARERDDMLMREAQAREELDTAKQAMRDWEVLATEERSLKNTLNDRVAELEDQLSSQKELFERAAYDRDSQSTTIDGLQRALQDVQAARKQELRELAETSQAQLEDLRKQLQFAESSAQDSGKKLESLQQELDRTAPFEKEVKEKNLLIGKLRHEAVILNDHLTKALRFLKRGKPEDNVDRQIITNHLIQFLAFDRSDPKKFEVLQLIAALLGWTEEQKESAGLARPGTASIAGTGSLRAPASPFRRVSSNTTISNVFSGPLSPSSAEVAAGTPEGQTPGRETLAELWSGFLEREAQDGGSHSRRTSVTTIGSAMGTPVITSPGTSQFATRSKPGG